jgi:hypothetical protein
MNKLFFLITLSLIVGKTVTSQQCLPNGIDFTTQMQIDSFPINYPNCTKIIGNVDIFSDDINNLDSLISVTRFNGQLNIWNNPILESLAGLSNTTSISDLRISGNNELTNLEGLENIDSLVRLMIWGTDMLNSLDGLNNVSYIYNINIQYNKVLSDLSRLSNISPTVGYVQITANDSLYNLSGLENINTISGFIYIVNNPRINDLSALENIDSIGSTFYLTHTSVTDLSGLSSLTYIGEDVWLGWNNELDNFSGLENLNTIGGRLWITDNDKLTSLTGLDNLDSINGNLKVYNNSLLNDISALENLVAESILDLSIEWNPLLSNCAIKSICDYLSSPNGEVIIENNDEGCSTQGEVEESCLVGKNITSIKESKISIFPNPVNNEVNIMFKDHLSAEVNIYNKYGQKVLSEFQSNRKIDITSLKSGIYVIELITNQTRIREKLIIKK